MPKKPSSLLLFVCSQRFVSSLFFPLCVWGLAVLAVVLRLVHLTDRSLWFDEAFSWRLISFPWHEFVERASADVHPLLYYIVLRVWMGAVHVFHNTTTLFDLRFPSVLFGAATVLVMGYAGRALFSSQRIGIVTALLVAINSFQLQYAWEARMYTLGTFLFPLALFFLAHATNVQKSKKRIVYALAFGVTAGLFLHVHYYALFSVAGIVGGLFLWVCYMGWKHRRGRLYAFIERIWPLIVGSILPALLFLPWLRVFLEQRAHVEASYWIPPMNNWSIPTTMARLLLGAVRDISHTTALLCTTFIIFCLFLPLLFGKTKNDLLVFCSFIFPFLGSYLLSQSTSIYQDRYFVFASLALLLLLARSFSFLPVRPFFIASGIVVLCGMALLRQLWGDLQFSRHPGVMGAATFLQEHATSSEPVLVSSSFIYFPVRFHLQYSPLHVSLYSETGELSHFSGGPILLQSDIEGKNIFTSHPLHVWIVDTTGFGGSHLPIPPGYIQRSEHVFPELFGYQGDIVVKEYISASMLIPSNVLHTLQMRTMTSPKTQ